MSPTRYAILILVLVALGLLAVWEHMRLLSAGYKVSALRSRRTALEQEARALERRIDSMATPTSAASMLRNTRPEDGNILRASPQGGTRAFPAHAGAQAGSPARDAAPLQERR